MASVSLSIVCRPAVLAAQLFSSSKSSRNVATLALRASRAVAINRCLAADPDKWDCCLEGRAARTIQLIYYPWLQAIRVTDPLPTISGLVVRCQTLGVSESLTICCHLLVYWAFGSHEFVTLESCNCGATAVLRWALRSFELVRCLGGRSVAGADDRPLVWCVLGPKKIRRAPGARRTLVMPIACGVASVTLLLRGSV